MLHSELVFWVCIETKAFLSPFTVTMASLLGQGDLKECLGIRGGMKRYCARVGERGMWRGEREERVSFRQISSVHRTWCDSQSPREQVKGSCLGTRRTSQRGCDLLGLGLEPSS